MSKKLLLLPCLALLCAGCSLKNQDPSSSSLSEGSSNNLSSSEEASLSSASSEEGSSSSAQEDAKLLAELTEKLRSYEGDIVRKKTSLTRTFVYPSDGYFGITVLSEETSTRYTYQGSYLVDSLGTEDYGQEESEDLLSYHAQIFTDGAKYYSIKEYEDGSDRSQSSILCGETSEERVFSLGFANEEEANFSAMISYAEEDPDHYAYTFENMEGEEDENKLVYSYSLLVYSSEESSEEEEPALASRISYTNRFTLREGKATHLSQSYLSENFAGTAVQSLAAVSEIDYFQGECAEYQGELLSIGKDTK